MSKLTSRVSVLISSIAILALFFGSSAFASSSVHDVYATAASGHVREALNMMDQVLAEHPNSGQAHFVEAELLARVGDMQRARSEFSRAQQLSPGLPFAKPSAVQSLQMQLNATATRTVTESQRPNIPWGTVIMIGLIVVSIMLFISARRRAAMQAQPSVFANTAPPFGSGYGPAPTGGMGSSILGGLATGAAIGAGMVAGEALANRLMDGHDEHSSNGSHPDMSNVNSDMGGNDFGLNDSSSWDSGSSGDFGGGDFGGGGDWS